MASTSMSVSTLLYAAALRFDRGGESRDSGGALSDSGGALSESGGALSEIGGALKDSGGALSGRHTPARFADGT